MSLDQRIALALQGFGAGVQGRGPEFLQSLNDQKKALSEERKQALIEDAFTAHRDLTSGNVGRARKLIINRLDAIKKLGGDPSDTAGLLNKIDSGDIQGAISDLDTVLQFAHATGRIKLPQELKPKREIIDGQLVTVSPDGQAKAEDIEGFRQKPQEMKTQVVDGQLVTIDPNTGQAQAAPIQGLQRDRGQDIDRALEREKLDLEARRLAIMEASEDRMSRKLSAGLEKALLESQDKTVEAQRNSNEFSILADQYASAAAEGGVKGTVTETLKGFLGTQDDVSELKRRFNQVRLSEGLKNLPPGPATDRDVQEAFKGVPKENASPEQVTSFLRGASRLARFEAGYNQYKSDYISRNSTGKGLNQGWRRSVNAPKLKREVSVAEIYETAQNRGVTPEQILEQLGIDDKLF